MRASPSDREGKCPSEPTSLHENPEGTYQIELYRTIFNATGGCLVPVPEFFVGRSTNDTRIDFVVGNTNAKWGVEALLDNDEIAEHFERFVGGGKYAQAGLGDFVVLNFHKDIPRKAYSMVHLCICCTRRLTKSLALVYNTFRCVFANDFHSFTVYDASTLAQVDRFILLK